MIVLSRRQREQIVINDNIIITVVAIRGLKVQIGVSGPDGTAILRREVYDAIHRDDPPEPNQS